MGKPRSLCGRPLFARPCARSRGLRSRGSRHGWNDELRTLLDPARPARGHGLGSRVKAHSIGAVLVQVAEAGALPSAEGIIGERYRYGHVYTDHADTDAGGE